MRGITVAVVGCGNIGSRHLQGLARLPRPAEIHIVEPSETASETARARFRETSPDPALRLVEAGSISALPPTLDLAIVATSSGPRLAAMEALLRGRAVRRLVLEKFLFPRHRDYAAAETLIRDAGVETYVNTPRRMWPDYAALRARLGGRGPLTMLVETSRRNGMASNAIHFLDLAAYLTGAADGFALDGAGLQGDADAARRGAGVEFSGVLAGRSSDDHAFLHRSRLDHDGPHVVALFARGLRMVIDESAGDATLWDAETGESGVSIPVRPVFQSALSHLLAPAQGRPTLPDFAESARLHRQCLSAFLTALGEDPKDPDAVCPVT
jgi:predicted dehydrogenase